MCKDHLWFLPSQTYSLFQKQDIEFPLEILFLCHMLAWQESVKFSPILAWKDPLWSSPRNVNLDISQLEMSFTLISEEGSSHDFRHSCPDFQMFLDSQSSPQAIPCTEITLREGQKLNEGGPSLRCRFYGCGMVPGICISWTNNSKNSYASYQRTHSKTSL